MAAVTRTIRRFLNISVTGARHLRNGEQCQDHSTSFAFDGGVALIVADGAGDARNTHSAWASATAVEVSTTLIHPWASDLARVEGLQEKVSVFEQLLRDIDSTFAVRVHDAGYTIGTSSTTLNIALVTDDCIYYGGIGDGFILVATSDGGVHLPVPVRRDGRRNEADFLGTGQMLLAGFSYVLVDSDVDAVMLSTDGLEEAFLDFAGPGGVPGTRPLRPVRGRIDDLVRVLGDESESVDHIRERLNLLLGDGWIREISEDDLTIALTASVRSRP